MSSQKEKKSAPYVINLTISIESFILNLGSEIDVNKGDTNPDPGTCPTGQHTSGNNGDG